MSTRHQNMQLIMKTYREKHGAKEWNMHDVAAWAISQGWRAPKPMTPVDMLAQEFSRAAREEIRHDAKSGHPYRANHVLPSQGPNGQLRMMWFDIDDRPSRKQMLKSLMGRRDQMIGDGVQLSFDADHWNDISPAEQPINIPFDLTDDIEERKMALDEDDSKSA